MNRFRPFVIVAAAATVAGLAAPITVAAAPAAAPRHPAPRTVVAAPLHAAVQWLPSKDGQVSGIVHYSSGLIAHIARRHSAGATPAARLRQAARPRPMLPRTADAPAVVPVAHQARLTGRVFDTEHHGLADVEVDVFAATSDEPSTSTTTNANGYYSVALAAGGYFVEFDGSDATGGNSDATGYVGTGDPAQLPADGHVIRNETLHPGAQLRVRVTDSSAHPLAGVSPEVRPITPYVHSLVGGIFLFFGFETNDLTGPDGTFTFRGLPSDAGRVCFSTGSVRPTGGAFDKLGYADRCSRRPIALAPGSSTTYPTVQLSKAPGGTVTGAVTSTSGDPIVNAEVDAEGATGGGDFATTGTDGSYRIAGLAPGSYRVCVVETDGSSGGSRLGHLPGCHAGRVEVRRGAASTADISLRRGGAIFGRITGPSGAPVQDAMVIASGAGGRRYGFAFTDADGQYQVTGLGAGMYRVCVYASEAIDPENAGGDQGGCYQPRVPVVVGSAREHIDVQLSLGGAIAGRVTDASGAGVADAQVSFGLSTDPRVGGVVIADANGDYRIGGLPAGSYRACITVFEPDGGISQRCPEGATSVSTGDVTEQDLSVAPPPSRGSIAVTVRDDHGRPVQGVDVVVLKPCGQPDPFLCGSEPLFGHRNRAKLVDSRMVDNGGQVRSDGRKPGSYAVCLFAYYGVTTAGPQPTGYSDRCAGRTFTVTVQAGAVTHVHLTLRPGGRVEGRITDAGRRPIPQAAIHISRAAPTDYADPFADFPLDEPGVESPLLDAATNKDGRFSIRGIHPGGHKVCVQAPPNGNFFDRCAHHGVNVTANAKTGMPDIVLSKAGAIAGVVRDGAGNPLHRGAVLIFRPERRTKVVSFAILSPNGHYRASGLKTGRYGVCFGAPHRLVECYDQVPWHTGRHPLPPKDVTKVRVRTGHTTTGIDAVLRRRK